MGKVYDFNSFKNKNNKKSSFNPSLLLYAIFCYCFDSIGAFVVLMIARRKSSRLITFHAAQSMLFYAILYLSQVVLQSAGYTIFNMFGLGAIVSLLFKLLLLAKIAFIVFGFFYLVTEKPLYIPYLSDIASRWG